VSEPVLIKYNWQFRKKNIRTRQLFWYDEPRDYNTLAEAVTSECELLSQCRGNRCKGHRVVMKLTPPSTTPRTVTVPVFYLNNSKL
jgi:hypothetical protein